jgi:DNA-binding transcriptional ArsR family regulator
VTDELFEPPRDQIELSTVLAALADPGRLAMVRRLAEVDEDCCTAIAESSGLRCGKSTLSHHTRVLRESGVAHSRVAGTRRMVSLRRDDLDMLFPGLIDAVVGHRAPAPAS